MNIIKEVWANNFEEEILRLSRVLQEHRFVAFDTEFPGFVHPSPREASENERFDALVLNVNKLKVIQLGLVLFSEHGSIGGCWQFNFSDFDVETDPHVPESISLLRRNGINFEKNRKEGVDQNLFAEMFQSVFYKYPGLNWVTFHGIYDVAYLAKLVTKRSIPSFGYDAFGAMIQKALGGVQFDVKKMADYFYGKGSIGLDKLSKLMNVERVGEAHQAGSDSLLTALLFLKFANGVHRNVYKSIGGYLYGCGVKIGYRFPIHFPKHPYNSHQQCYIPFPPRCFQLPRPYFVIYGGPRLPQFIR